MYHERKVVQVSKAGFGIAVLLPLLIGLPLGRANSPPQSGGWEEDAAGGGYPCLPLAHESVGGPQVLVSGLAEREEPPLLSFLRWLWLSAWGVQFIEGQSGMVLTETLDPLVWGVLVADSGAENPNVAEGTFTMAVRVPLYALDPDPNDLAGTPILALDHHVTAGVVYGSTGFESPVYGVLVKLVVAPPDRSSNSPVTTWVFTPLGVAGGVNEAIDLAFAYHVSVSSPPRVLLAGHPILDRPFGPVAPSEPPPVKPPPPPSNCPRQLCYNAAELQYQAERHDCIAMVAGLVTTIGAGCLAFLTARPLIVACGAGAIGGNAIVVGHCILAAQKRLEAAKIQCDLQYPPCPPPQDASTAPLPSRAVLDNEPHR